MSRWYSVLVVNVSRILLLLLLCRYRCRCRCRFQIDGNWTFADLDFVRSQDLH